MFTIVVFFSTLSGCIFKYMTQNTMCTLTAVFYVSKVETKHDKYHFKNKLKI